jgi:hypothetical protein
MSEIFWVEKSGHSVLPVHDVEGQVYPLPHLPPLHLPPVQQVGSVPVDNGVEGESVPPGLGEVGDLDSRVFVRRLLGPSQQRLLGGEVLLTNNNVRDLEVEDDRPDQTEGQLGVSIHNVLSPNVDKFDLFVSEEAESSLHILDCMESHPTSFSGQYFPREDFK